MQYKDLIKAIFDYDQEDSKEAMHIKALETKILAEVSRVQNMRNTSASHSSRNTNWFRKMPVAFAAILLFVLIAGITTASATGMSVPELIAGITHRLQVAIGQANKTGEFTVDEHGERVYSGKTAEEMEKLHDNAQKQIKDLKARPAAERAKSIESLKVWVDKYLYTVPDMPKQDSFEYGGIVGLNSDPTHHVEIYLTHDYEFQVDPEDNKLYDVSIRGSRAKNDTEKTYEDMTLRYNQTQLEDMARKFIASQNLEVDLNKLTFEKGSKIGTYFFTWTGDDSMKKPLRDPKGVKVCGDVSNPEFYENGAGCITQHESFSLPSIQVGFTQGGQLIGFTNNGF